MVLATYTYLYTSIDKTICYAIKCCHVKRKQKGNKHIEMIKIMSVTVPIMILNIIH